MIPALQKPKGFGIMPTIVRQEGFCIRVYTHDHPPPHVHVAKSGAIVKIDLISGLATEIDGEIADHEVKRAELLVREHETRLYNAWVKIHGQNPTN